MTSPALGAGTLVAVHAHPDDETLTTGGLIARWAQAGGRVVVVTCTRGEMGETIGDDLAALEGDREALAAWRVAERERALAALGESVAGVFLDELPPDGPRYVDSGMAWGPGGPQAGVAVPDPQAPANALSRADLAQQSARLAGLLTRERPAVVVTYEPGGGYGHPDHVRAHDIVMGALAAVAADPQGAAAGNAPRLWWAVVPRAEFVQMRHIVADAIAGGSIGLTSDAVGRHRTALFAPEAVKGASEVLPPVASDRWSRALRVATGPVADRTIAALRAYRSQVQAVQDWSAHPQAVSIPHQAAGAGDSAHVIGAYALSNGVMTALADTEWYVDATDLQL